MNHFNFFENIGREKETTNYPMICAVLFVCTAIVVGGFFAAAQFRLHAAEHDYNYLLNIKNDPSFITQCNQEKELAGNVNALEEYYLFLRTTEWLVNNGSTADDALVKTIASNFNEDTKILKITVSRNDVVIDGIARNPAAMIKVEKNFNNCKTFDYVFISTAKQDSHTLDNGEDAVAFTCKLRISEKGTGN